MATVTTPQASPADSTPAPTVNVNVPSPATPIVKPGWLTSEHVLQYVSMLLSALYLANVIPTSGPIEKVCAVMAIMLGNLGYTVGRSIVKSSAHKVAAAEVNAATLIASSQIVNRSPQSGRVSFRPLLAMATLGAIGLAAAMYVSALAGCTKVETGAKVMSGNFETCAKADLGGAVAGNVGNLLSVVTSIVDADKPTLESDLAAIAASVGQDAVKCAIYAIQSVLEPATPTPTTGQAPPPPGLTRALAWSGGFNKGDGK